MWKADKQVQFLQLLYRATASEGQLIIIPTNVTRIQNKEYSHMGG